MRAFTISWYALSFWCWDIALFQVLVAVTENTWFDFTSNGISPIGLAMGFVCAIVADLIATKLYPKEEQEDTDGSN